MKNKQIKILFIILSILFIIPSIIYLIQNKTVLGFETYYNFFISEGVNKNISTIIYLIIFVLLTVIYLKIVKKMDMFSDIKEILKYVTIVAGIFMIMLPWTSSDIFYYMGVGELDAVYKQNPYYVTMKEYYQQNEENIDDEILEQGAMNFWAPTTVVYGPVAQIIFKLCASVSMKNVDICIIVFKLVNLSIHLANCYLMYKISGKKKFAIIYGINPYILLEFIAQVHNDVIIVFFVLLTLYFLIKKKNILLSILFLALATGIKYFTVLLLPIIILYYFKEEKDIGKRFLKCIQYGIIFFSIFGLEYIPYFKNVEVLLSMMPQTARYSKSIYSALSIINWDWVIIVRGIFVTAFIYLFICFCFEFLLKKKNNIFNMLRKYNFILILFLLILTNCHQWYLVWLFATIMWQKPNMMRNIIGVSAITEIANSVYMFKSEWYIYDMYFVGIIVCLFVIWQVSMIDDKRANWCQVFGAKKEPTPNCREGKKRTDPKLPN